MEKRVLIADDHRPIRHVVKQTLVATLGIAECEEATNGREAVERAERSKPDLIILDFNMPEMDGVTAAKHLKSSMPHTPIILFTMYELSKGNAQNLGVDAIVSKTEGLASLTHQVELLLSS